MPKDLNILILNSEALKLSVEDLVNEINVPVNYDIVDMSDKDNIRKILPKYNVLVSTSLDVSMKNESKNLKAKTLIFFICFKYLIRAASNGCSCLKTEPTIIIVSKLLNSSNDIPNHGAPILKFL